MDLALGFLAEFSISWVTGTGLWSEHVMKLQFCGSEDSAAKFEGVLTVAGRELAVWKQTCTSPLQGSKVVVGLLNYMVTRFLLDLSSKPF